MVSVQRSLLFLETYYGKDFKLAEKKLCLEKHMQIIWPCNNLKVWKIHERSLFWITGILMPTIGFLGLLLSLTIAFVFFKMRKSKATTAFVVALAFSDIGVLIVGGIMNIFRAGIHYEAQEVIKSYKLMVINVYFISSSLLVFQSCTVNIMVSLSVFRYLAIRFPLKAYRLCSRRRALVTILISVCLAVLFTGSQFNSFKIAKICIRISKDKCVQSVYQYVLNITKFWVDFQYYLALVVVNFLPWLTLVVSSILLTVEIKKSTNAISRIGKASSDDINKKRKQERRISKMFLLVIAMTSLLYLPQVVYVLVSLIDKKLAAYHPYLLIFSYISNGLVVVNSTINFFLYLAVNKQFRQDLMAILCRARLRRDQTSPRTTKTQLRSIASVSSSLESKNIS
ncbi:unnamed protein product [Dimorphilus gyrociliatus]|uniref:G-protein coupled receptors family 1 profile domain-containing protein n=1 Tax=Dimorphilus gyrociliatus TaxID=2664684 RepID=A0A7I8VDP4_9ANNE|nr:unnamed protein product [Dimorphilus gyrociliatus]